MMKSLILCFLLAAVSTTASSSSSSAFAALGGIEVAISSPTAKALQQHIRQQQQQRRQLQLISATVTATEEVVDAPPPPAAAMVSATVTTTETEAPQQQQQPPVPSTATPLTNDSLRQAVQLWLGSDHNQAEVLSLLGPLSEWDTSGVTDMNALFRGAGNRLAADEDLSSWNTARVTDMADLLSGCTAYRGTPSLEGWDTSRVTNMARMFRGAIGIRTMDLSVLDVSSVTDMSSMFQGATLFEGVGLDSWDTGNVQFFNDMFNRATNFNADISNWNMGRAAFLQSMFENAVSFNQDLSPWSTTLGMGSNRVVSMEQMFKNTAQFDQSLCWTHFEDTDRNGGMLTTDMFCGSHPGAHLDPCCVDASMIEAACCSTGMFSTSRQQAIGSCDTYCPSNLTPTQTPFSNDPPPRDEIMEDEDNDMQEVTNVGDDAVDDNENESGGSNSIQDNEAEETADTETASDDNKNAWEGYVWLRVLVYILIIIVVGGIFLYYLHLVQRARLRRATEGSFAASLAPTDSNASLGPTGTSPMKQPVSMGTGVLTTGGSNDFNDEEVGTVQTKPTDEENVVTTGSGSSDNM